RERAHPRPARRVLRQKWRFGEPLVEIFDDRKGLGQHQSVDLERRDEALRIDRKELVRTLFARAQIPPDIVVTQALEGERRPHPRRGRRTEIAVEANPAHARGPMVVVTGARPSILTVQTSPATSGPTPAGVPVKTRSPGLIATEVESAA